MVQLIPQDRLSPHSEILYPKDKLKVDASKSNANKITVGIDLIVDSALFYILFNSKIHKPSMNKDGSTPMNVFNMQKSQSYSTTATLLLACF